jgi:hypothetical protein
MHSENSLLIGLALGSMFGHAAVAAGWTALGPGPLIVRLPLALLWIFALVLTIGFPLVMAHGEGGVFLVFIATLGGQWFLSQIPLWIVALTCGLRLRFQHELLAHEPRERQFGIRQLMIFTTIIAVILGLGRALLPLGLTEDFDGAPLGMFAFLVVSQLAMLLPLQFAIFLEKRALLASLISLVLIAVLTAVQWPLMERILGSNPGPKAIDFVCINILSTAWVLLFGVVVRLSGYHFGIGPGSATPTAEAPTEEACGSTSLEIKVVQSAARR